jgi:hypothetical protein
MPTPPQHVMGANPGVAQGAQTRSPVSISPLSRTEQERIRLDDCRNVIELMDEVQQGKQRAALAALRAGNFGGAGLLAQFVFAGSGAAWLAATGLFGGIMTADKFFATGCGVMPVIAAGFAGRAWFFRQLGAHVAAMRGAAARADRGAELFHADAMDRCNRAAHLSLVVSWSAVTVLFVWFDVFFFVSSGEIGLDPYMPGRPSRAFTCVFVSGMGVAAGLIARTTWLLVDMHMKRSQDFAVACFAVIGATCLVLAALGEGAINEILLGVVSACMLFVCLVLVLYLRHQQSKAMTAELQADIAAYEAAWANVEGDPVQLGYVASIEAKLKGVQGEACARQAVRPTFQLEQRATAQQLVIMLAQAWGLNGKFQGFADAWKAKLHEQGQLGGGPGGGGGGAGGASDEQDQGLLPKRRKRAIEKVWRGYRGDATKLRDLVRCSLVFETMQDLEAGLDVIVGDPAIRILRVKNRFARDYDAKTESCGYRDIQLNAVVTEQSLGDAEIALGLHEHVCEIQFHLRPIYELKNDEGHRRYVTYRNQRAE